jgi:hypothetical protein
MARKRLPKLSKTVRWALTIGIILIPIIVLGVIYSQHWSEESGLRADVEAAPALLSSRLRIWQQKLVERNQTQAELQQSINGTTADVEQTQSQLGDDINGTVYDLSQVHLLLGGVISGLDTINLTLNNISRQLDNLTQREFPYNYTQSIEIGDELFQDAVYTGVNITSYTSSLPGGQTVNGVTFQVFSISLWVEGQVPNLLDFNIKVNETFPDCNFKSVLITMPAVEGGIATMTFDLDIYCYG